MLLTYSKYMDNVIFFFVCVCVCGILATTKDVRNGTNPGSEKQEVVLNM